MTDASNLKTAIEFCKTKPKEIRVNIKGWARIKRDLEALRFIKDIPYTSIPDEDKWLWHEKKWMMRQAQMQIMGIPVRRID